MKYYIWTSGCQMNVADSQRMASALEKMGYESTGTAENADVILLNTCVVRQSAEDRAVGRLSSLRKLKEKKPDLVINLMGCLVGIKDPQPLRKRFPYVDVFSAPSDPAPLLRFLHDHHGRTLQHNETQQKYAFLDGDLPLPEIDRGHSVTAYVPIVYGCSFACTYCIIPYRRGPEESRPVDEIVREVEVLTNQGIREVTLLGQIVDRYGMDLPDHPGLPLLLRKLHENKDLERIRFLTSHPNWMTDDLIDTVAELPKVCEHIEVPIQAGDDTVLQTMKRGYTSQEYIDLIHHLREKITGVSIATDIIVGFPGETKEQFENTYVLMKELRMDVAHLARYSSRPGTVATRRMEDNVPEEEKMRRFRILETLQAEISEEIHRRHIGKVVEVMIEEKHKEQWKGRTKTNKLVFFNTSEDLQGKLVRGRVEWAGPWSLRAELVEMEN